METYPFKQSASQLSQQSWGIIDSITLFNRVLAESCLDLAN